MGRRKKEPESTHRKNIAWAAEQLFINRGFEAVTMDDIAKEAGYSKATLYVYFKNKEEIIGFLVLKSMKQLLALITDALSKPVAIKEKYDNICKALTHFQEQYPIYFSLALGKINVDFNKGEYLPVEKETFEVGEQINAEIAAFIHSGIDAGEFLPDIPILPTVLLFWASLAGLIQMTANKQSYIEKAMGLSKQQFLELSFERLFLLIATKGKDGI